MPLQFVCPFCKTSQLASEETHGGAVACAKCGRAVKIARAPAAVPLARPVPPPSTFAVDARPGARPPRSNAPLYVVAGLVAVTMLVGIALAVFFRPGRERPAPPPKTQAKAKVAAVEPELTKPAPPKKVQEAPEAEPESDVEPPPPLLSRTMGEWYLDGAAPKVRLDFNALDPAAVVKELKVVVWTGDVGAPKAASWRRPRVRSNDSPRQEIAVAYQDGRGTVDVPLPPLPQDKVYWLQPTLVDGAGKQHWLAVEPWEPAAAPLERRPALLRHKSEAAERTAQLSSQATATVRDADGKPFVFIIGVGADLTERIKSGQNAATLHVQYGRVQFEFSQDGVPAIVEKALGKALEAAAKLSSQWRLDRSGVIDQRSIRFDDVPVDVRKDVMLFDERLAQALELLSLHLPNREIKALESWTHERPCGKARLELTATYEGRRNHQQRDEAYLTLRGTLRADKQKDAKVEGTALVDLGGGFVAKAELRFATEVVVPYVGPDVRGSGRLEVRLTREPAK